MCYSQGMTLPDPRITGPCEAQVTFMCTEAGWLRLNPLAMLPGERSEFEYVQMCQPCYDHLADEYVRKVHA